MEATALEPATAASPAEALEPGVTEEVRLLLGDLAGSQRVGDRRLPSVDKSSRQLDGIGPG